MKQSTPPLLLQTHPVCASAPVPFMVMNFIVFGLAPVTVHPLITRTSRYVMEHFRTQVA